MTDRTKRVLKNTARAGADGVWGLLLLVLKVLGTVVLIGVTTGAIFACIFILYINTNIMGSTKLEVSLENVKLDLSSAIYAKNSQTGLWEEVVTLESGTNRVWLDYEELPLDLEHAVVAIEDQRFYRHHGVDWYRTAGAFVNMFLGMKNTFGGSTITQQLIKNVTGENEATVNRKLIEIFRALEFEKLYDKKEIIEWYLNDVYFGHGQYGIGAAAQYYYGKEVTELTVAEMASIVGITNNPSLYSPYVSRERNKYRQETILGKMLEQGYLSEAEYQTAKAQELEFLPYKNPVTHATVYSYYVDTVISDVLKALQETQGISEKVASNLLYHGGVSVYCCMDPAIQAKVDSIYQNLDEIPLPSGSSQQLQSGIVIQDPFTGDIVAMAGGVGTEKVARGLNRASGSLARRPSGSSIKPISVYAPAMDAGLITPNTSFEDEAYVTLSGTSWMPKNDDNKYHGVVTLRTGIVHSYNTIAAQVLDKLTPQASYKFLTEMLNFTSLEPQDMDYAPLAVGQQSIGVTPREMAAGFSIFVNSGVYTEGRTFSTVCDSDGTVLVNNIPDSHPAISDTTAYWMTSILQDAVTYGTGKSAKLSAMPTAGKTGTSSNYKDRWFVGYTPYYTCAVWTGYDRPERIQISGNPAAVLWKKVMELVHEGLPAISFTTPANTYQAPVIGTGDPVPYFVRGMGIENDGSVSILYEEQAGARVAGRTVTVNAKLVDDYALLGDATQTLKLSANGNDNVVEFRYRSLKPVEEPPVEEPPVEEPPIEEPPVEETPAEEQPTEEPPAEEPPATEEPPAVEPPEETQPPEEELPQGVPVGGEE